jgi:hypothetical protein
MLLAGWFEWAMRQADTPASLYKPVSHIATGDRFATPATPVIFR